MSKQKMALDVEAVRAWRRKRNITQSFMAELIGCGVNTLILWEQDGMVHPRYFVRMHEITEELQPWQDSTSDENVPPDPARVLYAERRLGVDLAAWRNVIGFEVEQLARRLGCRPDEVRQWERDGLIPPRMAEYAQGLDNEIKYVLRRTMPPWFLLLPSQKRQALATYYAAGMARDDNRITKS